MAKNKNIYPLKKLWKSSLKKVIAQKLLHILIKINKQKKSIFQGYLGVILIILIFFHFEMFLLVFRHIFIKNFFRMKFSTDSKVA